MEPTAGRARGGLSPAVVLVRPREEGNIGAAARAMANMGLERLILVEPAPAIGGVARGFGVGGWHILEAAERAADLAAALAPFGRTIGTTSSRERRLRGHLLLEARALPELLLSDPPATPTALVFGPERGGLSREELALCSPLVSIPAAAEHPTLNLAQAVLILAYELWIAGREDAAESRDPAEILATGADLDRLAGHAGEVLAMAGHPAGGAVKPLLRELRTLLARASPSIREVRMVRKLCRRLIAALAEGREPG